MDQPSAAVDPRVCMVFLPSPDGSSTALDLYQPFVDLINPNIQVLASANQNPLQHDQTALDDTLDMPSSAVVLYLQQDTDLSEVDRLTKCAEYLASSPWKFHHSELVSEGAQPKCQDFYVNSDELPLCSAQQVVHGCEILRIVKFVTVESWADNITFYSRILNQRPDITKQDLVIFTLEHHSHFDVQFTLKKLPKEVIPRSTRQMVLSFKVDDIGALVPLLHAECHQMNSTHWVTVDFDGNEIFLEQTQKQQAKPFLPNLQSISENHLLPPVKHHEDTVCSDDENSSVFYPTDRFGSHHNALTSTPLSNKSGSQRRCATRHQRSDSGFSEARSEQSSKSNIQSLMNKLDLSVADVDMTVRSAYSGQKKPASYHHALKHADRTRSRNMRHSGSTPELDSKQTFTQLWVLNGHQDSGHHDSGLQTGSDEAQSTCSSVETAISDPSERGGRSSKPHRGILVGSSLHRAISMPCVATDSTSVSSSGSSGTRRSKNKSVKFSEHITEVTISPRVPPREPQKPPPLSNALRRSRVQHGINQIGQQTPQKRNTPARMAKVEERDKTNIGFWI